MPLFVELPQNYFSVVDHNDWKEMRYPCAVIDGEIDGDFIIVKAPDEFRIEHPRVEEKNFYPVTKEAGSPRMADGVIALALIYSKCVDINRLARKFDIDSNDLSDEELLFNLQKRWAIELTKRYEARPDMPFGMFDKLQDGETYVLDLNQQTLIRMRASGMEMSNPRLEAFNELVSGSVFQLWLMTTETIDDGKVVDDLDYRIRILSQLCRWIESVPWKVLKGIISLRMEYVRATDGENQELLSIGPFLADDEKYEKETPQGVRDEIARLRYVYFRAVIKKR